MKMKLRAVVHYNRFTIDLDSNDMKYNRLLNITSDCQVL